MENRGAYSRTKILHGPSSPWQERREETASPCLLMPQVLVACMHSVAHRFENIEGRFVQRPCFTMSLDRHTSCEQGVGKDTVPLGAKEHLTVLSPAGQYTMWSPIHLQASFHPVGYWSSGESQRPAHMTRTYKALYHTGTRLTGVSVQT